MAAREEIDVPAVWIGAGDGVRVVLVLAEKSDAATGSGFSAPVIHSGDRTGQTDRDTLAAARWLMPSLSPSLIADVLGLDRDPAEVIDSDLAE
jgi:hypothetical protein